MAQGQEGWLCWMQWQSPGWPGVPSLSLLSSEKTFFSAHESLESCNNLSEKNHLTSRVTNDFLAREATVTQATSQKHPLDRWLLNLVWDAYADCTEPKGRGKETAKPIPAPSFQGNGISKDSLLCPTLSNLSKQWKQKESVASRIQKGPAVNEHLPRQQMHHHRI